MQTKIPYGKEQIKIEITEPFKVLLPNKVQIKDEDKLALSDDACSLALGGNPVHEDMVDAMNDFT